MKKTSIAPVKLDLFDGTVYDGGAGESGVELNTNTTSELSAEMKTFYSDYLIDLAEPELVHDQFAQKHPIPANGGKVIDFRQFDPLPEMLTPLTEGVTPDGQSLAVRNLTATVQQYGGYVTLSDLLLLTAVDNNLVQATKLIASQAGRTLDTITREVVNAGTVVQFGGGVSARAALHYTSGESNCNLTVADVKKAVRYLETQDAPKIDGYYVGIIHPHCKYDLMNDPQWRNPHEYADTEHIYRGEIGELYGVRFVQSSRAKIFEAEPLTAGSKTLSVKTAITTPASTTVAVSEKITSADATALAGKKVMLGSSEVTISSATAGDAGSAYLTLSAGVENIAKDTVIYPEGAGIGGVDVYATLILADDAYGVTEVTGGGLQHIAKQLGSGGTSDALNQRATCGWKATKVAKILVPQYIVRIETTATP